MYELLSSTYEQGLVSKVNEYVLQGWSPLGGMMFGNGKLYQAVVIEDTYHGWYVQYRVEGEEPQTSLDKYSTLLNFLYQYNRLHPGKLIVYAQLVTH